MSNDYVCLIGTEDVSNAGHQMREAAQSMSGTAESIEFTSTRLIQGMQECVVRMEAAVEKMVKAVEDFKVAMSRQDNVDDDWSDFIKEENLGVDL